MRNLLALLLLLGCANAAESPIVPVGSPAPAGAAEPFLAATRDGVLLSWLEPAGDRTALRFARYANGRWSKPRTIVERADLVVNWADFPSIVEDAQGTLFAHWLQKSGRGMYASDVRMATSKDGGATWGAPFLLNRDGKQTEHGFATLAPLPNGGIVATWLDGRKMNENAQDEESAGEMSLRYATIDANGRIANDVELDGRTCECCTTGMTVSDGVPLIAYRDRSSDEVRDIAIVRGRGAPKPLHADGWKINGCPVNGPQIDAIGKRVVAAWFTAANEKARVNVAFSDDGGATFATPVQVDGGKPAGRVDVVLLSDGSAFVSWLEQTATGGEIRARRVPRHGRPAPVLNIAASTTARTSGFTRIARVGKDVWMAWTDQGKQIRVVRVRT